MEASEQNYFGECVGESHFSRRMEWVDYDNGWERIETVFFMGRFGDTVAYCTMNDDGDIFVLDDRATEDYEPSQPFWRAALEPDQVLVPVREQEPRHDD